MIVGLCTMAGVSISIAATLVVTQHADRGLDWGDRYHLERAHKQMLNYTYHQKKTSNLYNILTIQIIKNGSGYPLGICTYRVVEWDSPSARRRDTIPTTAHQTVLQALRI
jgi:hypothetical protein